MERVTHHDLDGESGGQTFSEKRNSSERKMHEELQHVLQGELDGHDFHVHYKIGRQIGKGSYGTIAECVDRTTGETLAVKLLRKSALFSQKDVARVRKEVQILNKLRVHRHVVEFHSCYEDHSMVYIVLELCSGGDMFGRLLQIGRYSERDAADICRQALMAINHMHRNGVVYRDLKPDNFLFTSSDLQSARLKATDFGLSSFLEPNQYLKSTCGTPLYCAPEVIRKRYDTKADIWSLGVTLYIMLSGKVPFWGSSLEKTFSKIVKGTFHFKDKSWDDVTDDAKDCVTKMLTYNPMERPDAQSLLSHPWIVENGAAAVKPLVDSVLTNLKQFLNMNLLQKRAIQIMATNLQLEDLKTVQAAFYEIDADQSGLITVAEMKNALAKAQLPITEEELASMWDAYDVDGDGKINYIEFLSATTTLTKIVTVENMRYAFDQLDCDASGKLSADEVKAKMHDLNIPLELIEEMIAEADTNNDGEIDYEEFVALMTDRAHLNKAKSDLFGDQIDLQSHVADGELDITWFS